MQWTADDCLITLGDYVDRGPDSRGVLEWVLARSQQPSFIALKGNHEVMMLMAREDMHSQKSWMSGYVGGSQTLASYGRYGMPGRLSDVPDTHWHLLSATLRLYWETEKFFFAHAGVDPTKPLKEQKEERLLWERFGPQPLHPSGKLLVCGHTEQPDRMPFLLPHGICIDTGVHAGGWLTALDVHTGRYGQATDKGEYREGFVKGWPS